MAYKFKKLSAVETVETVSDAASVLVEENGVIKKAPKGQVGGGSGFDFTIVRDDVEDSVILTSGTYQEMIDKIENKEVISGAIIAYTDYYHNIYTDFSFEFNPDGEPPYIMIQPLHDSDRIFSIFQDNSIQYNVAD